MSQSQRRLAASDAIVAGAVASLTSGVPSTVLSLWRGQDPLGPSLAAGTLLFPHERRRHRLLAAAAIVHAALSLGWAVVLTGVLPRRATFRWSVLAGFAIALVDLGVIGRRFDRIRALPLLPQLADHLAYTLTVSAVLVARRNRRQRSTPAMSPERCLGSPHEERQEAA